MCLKS